MPASPRCPLPLRQESDLIRLKRQAKSKGGFYVEPEHKLLFVIRIRGGWGGRRAGALGACVCVGVGRAPGVKCWGWEAWWCRTPIAMMRRAGQGVFGQAKGSGVETGGASCWVLRDMSGGWEHEDSCCSCVQLLNFVLLPPPQV